ncbi:MAG TPA: MBL fold metallo-hydrolase, partial [Dehalococcoidia bacterium]|nr:MBL fold metallo-hydrolase [Dehalococcoidia bacterium]
GRFQACIHIEAAGARFLLDCGPSALVAMKRFGVAPNEIDAVLISHFHGDHFAGIPFLILEGQFFGRTKPLAFAGPPGIEARARGVMEELFLGLSGTAQRFDYSFVDLQAGVPTSIAGLEVTALPVPHSGGSTPYGLRVAVDGKVVAYSGDSEWSETLIDLARGADLFICEANFFDRDVRNHLSYRTLMRRIGDFECRRIVLTHAGPEVLERRHELELELAEDGMTIEV